MRHLVSRTFPGFIRITLLNITGIRRRPPPLDGIKALQISAILDMNIGMLLIYIVNKVDVAGIIIRHHLNFSTGLDFWGREGRAAAVKIKVPSRPQNRQFNFSY